LMQRADEAYAEGTMVWSGAVVRTKPPSDKLIAETLRDRRNPSLTELLLRRIGQADDPGIAAEMTLQLATWDRKAAKTVLAAQRQRSRESRLEGAFLDLVRASADAGDQKALDEYADWLRALKRPNPDSREFSFGEALYPLRKYYRHPRLAEASDWLFNSPESPWVPLLRPQKTGLASYVVDLYEFGFVGIPAIRKAFLRDLADRKQLGTTYYNANGSRGYDLPGITNAGWRETSRDPKLPKQGVKGSFRVCDWVAYKMSGYFDGAPAVSCGGPRRNATGPSPRARPSSKHTVNG
jgi:hypothetical protein